MQIFLRFLYIVAIITFIYGMQYFIQVYGEKHYEKEDGTIFDPVHENTPDFFRYGWITNVIPVILLLILFVGPKESDLITEFFYKFLFILSLRALIGFSTILPKHEECEIQYNIGFFLGSGGCYDKLFSGHTAIVTLISLLLMREGFMSNWVFWITNIVNMIIIVLTRSHYTADVLLGFVIAYLIGNGDYGILPH